MGCKDRFIDIYLSSSNLILRTYRLNSRAISNKQVKGFIDKLSYKEFEEFYGGVPFSYVSARN